MRQQRVFLYYDFKACAIEPLEATLRNGQAIVLGPGNGLARWFRHARAAAAGFARILPVTRPKGAPRRSASLFPLCSHRSIVPQLISLICASSKV